MALHFTGLDCLSLSLTSPYCATPLYPGLNWNAPYRIASSLHVITIIAPNCIARLQMTVLHCMWMYSSGLDHTAELCTAPDVTWKDCSGLPELQWSWWQYIKLHLTCMQKTANKDWQYNEKRSTKPNCIMKFVSVSQDNSCFDDMKCNRLGKSC